MEEGVLATTPDAGTCRYSIYLPSSPSASTSAASTSAVCASVLAYAAQLCSPSHLDTPHPYIWQRDHFVLTPASTSPISGYDHFTGSTHIGESVEDEWWIVYLLLKISEKWKEAAIEIVDEDGQFLLIEAADALERWLTPSNAANRFWLKDGRFHLIPLTFSSSAPRSRQPEDFDPSGYISPPDAVESLTKAETLASPAISDIIMARVSRYPASLKNDHWHATIAYLPEDLVNLLSEKPEWVSDAVKAFYERDALQLKACQNMKRFPPTPSSAASSPTASSKAKSAKLATIYMTRALYAQLLSQKFYAPKVFEKAGWFSDASILEGSSAYRHREVGMKLSCGFEILYSSAPQASKGRPQGENVEGHLSQDKDYLRYTVALTNAGYFQGEIAGSTLYAQLEKEAIRYWETMKAARSDEASISSRSGTFAQEVDEVAVVVSNAAMEEMEQQRLSEDSDEWLYLNPERLESMLSAKFQKAGPEAMDSGMDEDGQSDGDEDDDEKIASREATRLQAMAAKLEGFVQGRGTMEGALFDDEVDFSDEGGQSDEASNTEEDEDTVAGADTKQHMLQRREERLQNLVPGLAEGEWGSNPSPATIGDGTSKKRTREEPEAAVTISTAAFVQEQETDKVMTLDQEGAQMDGTKKHAGLEGLSMEEHYDGASSASSDDETNADGNGGDDAPPEGAAELSASLSAPRLTSDSEDDDTQPATRSSPGKKKKGNNVTLTEDGNLDFGPGEMEEFLQFTREALGLSEDQYKDILKSRESEDAKQKEQRRIAREKRMQSNATVPTVTPVIKPVQAEARVQQRQATTSKPPTSTTQASKPHVSSARPSPNLELNSFEALMDAMDSELAKIRSSSSGAGGSSTAASDVKGSTAGNQKAKAAPSFRPTRISSSGVTIHDSSDEAEASGDDDEDYDMEDLDAELAAALKGATSSNGNGEESVDYTMIKNFLESFKSQGGLAGPVSNLFGRLGESTGGSDFRMPRDEE